MADTIVRRHDGSFHWEGVDVLAYKQEGSAPFKDVTRQVLFESDSLAAQLRYFEVAPGGHTTLERHAHVHVSVPPMTWHQFRAAPDQPLGFLCLVASKRDRPQLPDEREAGEIAKPL